MVMVLLLAVALSSLLLQPCWIPQNLQSVFVSSHGSQSKIFSRKVSIPRLSLSLQILAKREPSRLSNVIIPRFLLYFNNIIRYYPFHSCMLLILRSTEVEVSRLARLLLLLLLLEFKSFHSGLSRYAWVMK